MPPRIAQERVPRSISGRHDVTWASRPTPLIPFRVFSRVSRAPFPTLLDQPQTSRTSKPSGAFSLDEKRLNRAGRRGGPARIYLCDQALDT
jgi:hypothetical protein